MQVTNKYKDLVRFVEMCFYEKKEASYILSILKDHLEIYNSDPNKPNKKGHIMMQYYYECDEVRDFFKTWLSVTDDEFGDFEDNQMMVFVNSMNHYQFLISYNILDLLLTSIILKNKNIPWSNTFKITSKNGKVRDITAPNEDLKIILKRINTIFQKTYDSRNSEFQVAYKKGKSIKDNSDPHTEHNYVFKIDLHNFFPSCKRKYVYHYVTYLFKNSLNSEFLVNKFLDIILNDDALYIGNPVSGTLANVIISRPVNYIHNICKKFGIAFTVYADDMTFSSDKFITKDFIISIFNRAFGHYDMLDDFTLNESKCYGVSNTRRAITGVIINNDNKTSCHREMYQNIRQTLHQLSYGDESHYNFNKLQGNIAFMSMVDESGKLKNLLIKYKSTVKKYKLVSDKKLIEMGV